MSSILIDSSVWIEYFKGNKEYLYINELIYNNSICTNDLILTELPSMIQKKEKKLVEIMNSIVKYDIDIVWEELRNIQLINLQHGNNDVPITDLIITQNCLQNDLSIVARDKHFNLMSKYIPLKIYVKNIIQNSEIKTEK